MRGVPNMAHLFSSNVPHYSCSETNDSETGPWVNRLENMHSHIAILLNFNFPQLCHKYIDFTFCLIFRPPYP